MESSRKNRTMRFVSGVSMFFVLGLCLHTYHLKGNDASAKPFFDSVASNHYDGIIAFLLKMLSVIESCVWVCLHILFSVLFVRHTYANTIGIFYYLHAIFLFIHPSWMVLFGFLYNTSR